LLICISSIILFLHVDREPILRLLNLQRERCSRLDRFHSKRKLCLFSKHTSLLVAL
jgi:hypothetical protein